MLKKILIMGCGSIGQRHARNARKIGIEHIVLFDIDLARLEEFAKEINTDLIYSSLENLFMENADIDAAMVCTPSSLHLENSLFLAETGINLFIEKPLATKLEGLDELIKVVREKKLISMMGQSYRFHEGFIKLKELLIQGVIGKIIHVNYYGGQYLPDWHPQMDYRKEYAARSDLGGGVLLTTMSHALDNIQWLFGIIKNMTGWKTRLSNLEIDVEDSVFLLINTASKVVISTNFDFLQRCPQHLMIITGEKGHIKADFNEHCIEICKNNHKTILKYEFDDNLRYIKELKYFLEMVENNKIEDEIDVMVGKEILEVIFDARITEL